MLPTESYQQLYWRKVPFYEFLIPSLYTVNDIVFKPFISMSNYSIKQLPADKQPRERLIDRGPDTLSNSELLAIIFGTGTRNEGVLDLASRVIKEYGSRSITEIRDVNKAVDLLGLGKVKACQLISCFELGRRFFREDIGRLPTIRDPKDVYELLPGMRRLKKEEIRGLYLNSRQKLIHEETISVGSLNTNIIEPRDIFQPAIEFSALAVILVHNHPSGDPAPSDEDIAFTKRILDAGKILGVQLLDHIVVARNGFVSIRNEIGF